ncbi:CPBP family intramembrane glutamic endopeptidase [uncultured Fluviicola sp.]|uniref:CPBP family intramembrane glutamic endopeptidase n=1 Tax=uncultured Fluviicola sp. TaxID=463303 RepID=UPI0025F5ED09|nr:CPBP family intramembrane glutamic endopeptidase [uncultured Fluviicola sp.]
MLEKFRTVYRNYLFIKIITVILVVFFSVAIIVPLIRIAELFGINIREHTGVNFDVSFGNVFFFFLFGLCSIGIIWFAQKYIHQKKLSELGFQGKIWRTLLIGFIVGAILVSLKNSVLILSAENVKYVKVIPTDVSFLTYLAYYFYFMVGFIFWNSFIEELCTRAYPIKKLKNYMNPHIVFTVMGLIFSLGHFVLRDFSPGYFLSLFIFSYIFSLLYFYSNSIWLPIGIHSGVNWVEFSFFGTNWKLGAIYNIELYNIPDWSYNYANVFILSGFLLLIIYLNKKGFFNKYFSRENELEIKN